MIRPYVVAIAALTLAGGAATASSAPGWQAAQPGYRYSYPADYGSHESYRDEWWYYTGNVRNRAGRRFGFELTVFRYGVEHPMSNASAWDINDLYFAHFALADVTGRRFISFDRTERGALGAAGASSSDERAWVDDWRIQRGAGGVQIVKASDSGSSLALSLAPLKDAVPEGVDGALRMGGCALCYAHYYSFTRLAAKGRLVIEGEPFDVAGTGWNDHEWYSNALAPAQAGWDWFSIQLGDGVDLMIYRFRQSDGSASPERGGTFVDASGSYHPIAVSDFSVTPTAWWTSPHDNARYPSRWNIRLRSENADLTVTPVLADQELDTSHSTQVTYWEGACDVRGTLAGRSVNGVGYTELTGYAPSGATAVR